LVYAPLRRPGSRSWNIERCDSASASAQKAVKYTRIVLVAAYSRSGRVYACGERAQKRTGSGSWNIEGAFVNLIWPLLMLSFGPTWPLSRLPVQTRLFDPLPY